VTDENREKAGPKQAATRDGAGRFRPGASGNPRGKPPGLKHKTTVWEAQLDAAGPKLLRKIIQLALKGDTALLRWAGDRLLPIRKDRHIELALGDVRTAADALEASRLVLAAVAAGTLTPSEGEQLSKALSVHIGLHGAVEVEAQLGMLEQAHGLGLPS
jgi:hypothetical protein